jgi:hypothetical protein
MISFENNKALTRHAYLDQQVGYERNHFEAGIAVVDNDYDLWDKAKVAIAVDMG